MTSHCTMISWTYLSSPALVARTIIVLLMHEVRALLVIVSPAEPIRHSWRYARDSVERLVAVQRILNALVWSGLQRLFVAGLQRRNRRVFRFGVPRQQRCIVGTFMMVRFACNGRIKAIDGVRSRDVVLPQMWAAVCLLAVFTDDLQRLMATVAGISLLKRASSATMAVFGGLVPSRRIVIRWRRLRTASWSFVIVAECLCAVVGESFTRAASLAERTLRCWSAVFAWWRGLGRTSPLRARGIAERIVGAERGSCAWRCRRAGALLGGRECAAEMRSKSRLLGRLWGVHWIDQVGGRPVGEAVVSGRVAWFHLQLLTLWSPLRGPWC